MRTFVEATGGDAEPNDEDLDRQVCFTSPAVDEIDDLVARVVGNAASL